MVSNRGEHTLVERQIALARAVLAGASLVALAVAGPAGNRAGHVALALLLFYLVAAVLAVFSERLQGFQRIRIPAPVDIVLAGLFLVFAPSLPAFWFLALFGVFSVAARGALPEAWALAGVVAAGIVARVGFRGPIRFPPLGECVGLGLGMAVSGTGIGALAVGLRGQITQQRLRERIAGLLQFDHGLSESIRQALGELALAFDCEQACLAMRDDDLERLFVWKVRLGDRDMAGPETLPLARAETFLIDCLEVTLAWEQHGGRPSSFGWDRRTGQRFHSAPSLPEVVRKEWEARSLLAATIEWNGRPAGRVLLVNARGRQGKFSTGQLRRLEQIVREIGRPLENIFRLRHLRAQTVEAERSRISRDLHDGILQTLLSLNIQLGVLRRKIPQAPENAGEELGALQKIVQQESEELRRMVTDLRPLRVESADLREMMLAIGERFRCEGGLALDLFIEDRDLRLPDRVCRELVQIYRESLHNIKKHAQASHVVVKLAQDDSRAILVVDDNGRGFSFSGRYTSEDLDKLRLGPISIKERTRSVGGTLTVDSNPGHGARLTIEIPVN